MNSKVRNIVKEMEDIKPIQKYTLADDWFCMEDRDIKRFMHKQDVKFDREIVKEKEMKQQIINLNELGAVNGVGIFFKLDRLQNAFKRYGLKENSHRISMLAQLISLGSRDTILNKK